MKDKELDAAVKTEGGQGDIRASARTSEETIDDVIKLTRKEREKCSVTWTELAIGVRTNIQYRS